MKNNNLLKKENLLGLFIFLFSLSINQYYGNRGIFPADSFAHFDTGFRILLGEYPFKNYWVVSGPAVDYFQAIFFYLFGANWQIYVFHASMFNGFLSLATFVVLRNFKLNIYYCLIYSLLFSVLAYPVSGTPFVDHHSAFFSLLGIYSLILGIKTENKFYWLSLPILLVLAFLSKQVPSSYVIITVILCLGIFLLIKKNYYWIKYFFISLIIFIFLLLVFAKIQGINLSSFIEQYIFYPQTIGSKRIDNFEFSLGSNLGHFKFIYIALIPLLFVNFKKILFEKNYLKNKDFYYFLILIFFTFSLIVHQILTRNQTFIFFLIPILFGFSHVYINLLKLNLKKFLHTLLVLICLFVVIKYHLRFNEGRKFHELNYVNFQLASEGEKIDEKFKGLKWITPRFSNNADKEIDLINEIKTYLSNDRRNKMVMTNYSFFSTILGKKLFSTTRWHIFDGTDYPQKNNKYFVSYKKLLINSIKHNNVEVIYTIDPVKNSNIYDYINQNCFEEKRITEILVGYKLKQCDEINNL